MNKIESFKSLLELQSEYKPTLKLRTENIYDTEYREILVCGGTGCMSSQSQKLIDNLNEEIKKAGLSAKVNAHITGCFGFCEQGPIVKVFPDDVFYVQVAPEDAAELVKTHLVEGNRVHRLLYEDPDSHQKVNTQHEMSFYKKQKRIALRNCGLINPELISEYIAHRGYEALGKCISELSQQEVIDEIKLSGLRGRGGGVGASFGASL